MTRPSLVKLFPVIRIFVQLSWISNKYESPPGDSRGPVPHNSRAIAVRSRVQYTTRFLTNVSSASRLPRFCRLALRTLLRFGARSKNNGKLFVNRIRGSSALPRETRVEVRARALLPENDASLLTLPAVGHQSTLISLHFPSSPSSSRSFSFNLSAIERSREEFLACNELRSNVAGFF